MKDRIFFTADAHWGESGKCAKERHKVFENYEHYMRSYINGWNAIVDTYDTVYLLGDMFTVDMNYTHIVNMLNGNKILIAGNNDKLHRVPVSVEVRGTTYLPEHNAYLSHFPLHPDMFEMKDWATRNIHGHCHGTWNHPNKSQYFDCGVDACHYRPVSIMEVNRFMGINLRYFETP